MLGQMPIRILAACSRERGVRHPPLSREVEIATGLKPRVVIPVDLFGQPADHDAIRSVADKHGLLILDDAAQSFGARYKTKKLGAIADITTTSFYPSKPLGCYGDGGAIFTNDDELAKVMRQIARHGQDRRYHHIRVGVNSRLDTLQAAILLTKLAVLDEELAQRQRVADTYNNLLCRSAPPCANASSCCCSRAAHSTPLVSMALQPVL